MSQNTNPDHKTSRASLKQDELYFLYALYLYLIQNVCLMQNRSSLITLFTT